jgi:hypothetical protein
MLVYILVVIAMSVIVCILVWWLISRVSEYLLTGGGLVLSTVVGCQEVEGSRRKHKMGWWWRDSCDYAS